MSSRLLIAQSSANGARLARTRMFERQMAGVSVCEACSESVEPDNRRRLGRLEASGIRAGPVLEADGVTSWIDEGDERPMVAKLEQAGLSAPLDEAGPPEVFRCS